MDCVDCIISRRSVRKYCPNKSIEKFKINKIIEAAIWTPSGKNGQPWKFKIITDRNNIKDISALSIYGNWMKEAPCLIAVFLDKEKSYHYIKDVQSCGAAIQNILLSAHSLGIGSCWIGEILSREKELKSILNITNDNFELMGVVTLGYQKGKGINVGRKSIEKFIIQ